MAESNQAFDKEKHKQLLEAVKADNCDKIRDILKDGYRVDAAHPETLETALMEACRCASTKAVELLISKGADPNYKAKSGRVALHVAVEKRNMSCIKVLLQTEDLLVDTQDSFGATPLMMAAHRGYREELMLLLKHGCDLELKNEFGWTALHYSVVEFEKHLGQNKVYCLKELIKAGSDLDVRSKAGYTPLHSAIQMGHFDSVKTLLDENCDTDIDAQAKRPTAENPPTPLPQKTLPMTPLSMALYFGNMPIAEMLLNYDCAITGLWDLPTQIRKGNTFLNTALAPRSLKKLCRKSIRKSLGQHISCKVEKLGLSDALTNYLLNVC